MQSLKCRMQNEWGIAALSFLLILHSLLCILNLEDPEVVATSPYRIKSPVPVCCGFRSLKLAGGRERTCTSKAHRFSICGVCYSLLTTRPKLEPPPGIAPNWLPYQRSASLEML